MTITTAVSLETNSNLAPVETTESREGRLSALVTDIRRYQRESDAQSRDNLSTRRIIGKSLNEAKRLLKETTYPGGWRKWCADQKWGTRWADSLIRLHTKWSEVQDAMKWMEETGAGAPDGVTAALKSINEYKLKDETPEEKELRQKASGRKDKKARNKAVARFVREVMSTGVVPDVRPVELTEFVTDILKDEEDAESESSASHSDDAEFDEASDDQVEKPASSVGEPMQWPPEAMRELESFAVRALDRLPKPKRTRKPKAAAVE